MITDNIRIKVQKEFHRPLKEQGISWSVFSEREFTLTQAVSNITYNQEGSAPQIINKKTQIDDFVSVMTTPFLKPYIYVVSGRPNDVRASCVAATLLVQSSIAHRAMLENPKGNPYAKMGPPRWIKLSNDFKDNVGTLKPSMIVLSNITPMSSNHKFEKVRDILEFHDQIPRVVVVNGMDPLEFCNTKIFHKPDYVMLLQSTSKRQEI